MTTSDIRAAIEAMAAKHGLEANLVEAMVLTESGGNRYATKPEAFYPYLMNVRTWKPWGQLTRVEAGSKTAPSGFPCLAGHPDHEWLDQQTSWGLMQVMGAVARELGCRSHYLSELTDPITGLHFGCKHFAGMLAWAKGDTNKAIAAYNAGRGGTASEASQAYVVKVRANLAQVQGTRRA
jgi:soluble lytic murein transglycosylase-like protein